MEAVPGLVNRQDVLGIGRLVLQLPPELGDVRVHRPAHDGRPVAPYFLQKIQSAGYGPPSSDEGQEQGWIVLRWILLTEPVPEENVTPYPGQG